MKDLFVKYLNGDYDKDLLQEYLNRMQESKECRDEFMFLKKMTALLDFVVTLDKDADEGKHSYEMFIKKINDK